MTRYVGYNIVYGEALTKFQEEYLDEYGHEPFPISIICFLRHVHHRTQLPFECVEVRGFYTLFEGADEKWIIDTQEALRLVLRSGRNWLEDKAYYIYFSLPDGVMLLPGADQRLDLRLHSGNYIALHNTFGRCVQLGEKSFLWPFSIDT